MNAQSKHAPPMFAGQRPAEGLYDPRHEHDACGVGFVVDIKGRKSHAIVRQALAVLINLLHRGACGCEPNTGDGAGILLQIPDRFFRRECAKIGVTLPAPTEYGAGARLPPARPPAGGQGARAHPDDHPRGRPALSRLAAGADRRPLARRHGGVGRAAHHAALRRARRRHRRPRALRAEALRHSQADRERGAGARRRGPDVHLPAEPLVEHVHLQGHAVRGPDRGDVSRPHRSGRRVGARARPPAVQHQHVPVVAAGAPVPLHRAQRRDQHAARQPQLDEGARGALPLGPPRRRPREGLPGHARGAVRLRHVRQRAGVPRDERPLAPARDPHDDPGAVAEPRIHEPRAAGVLRVPRVADGALGRPRLHRVHRRHGHRRGAGPQRTAPVALLRDEGRPRRHGVGGRRPRHPAPRTSS